ncbi:MAG: hypothetical protein U0736_18935 [Gemmataceae bacterium]
MRSGGAGRWVGFFVALAVLAAAAAVLPLLFNERQQLRRDQLAAARQRWTEHGRRDYDLSFSVQLDRDRVAGRYVVLVRGGAVVVAFFEGEPIVVARRWPP